MVDKLADLILIVGSIFWLLLFLAGGLILLGGVATVIIELF